MIEAFTIVTLAAVGVAALVWKEVAHVVRIERKARAWERRGCPTLAQMVRENGWRGL